MKMCNQCKRKLSTGCFYKQSHTKDGCSNYCIECHRENSRKSSKKRYAARRKSGFCGKCKEIALPGRAYCKKHALMDASAKALGTQKRWEELRQLLEDQNHRCAYSGVKIQLGVNASIDHRIPKSRGGKKELENVCWVDQIVNSYKHDRTEEEFLEWVRLIYENTLLSDVYTHSCKR